MQNAPTAAAWGAAVAKGHLPVERGRARSPEDRLRADMIESLLCRLALDLHDLGRRHGVSLTRLLHLTGRLRRRFAPWIEARGGTIRPNRQPRLIARLAAQTFDALAMPEGRHSRAMQGGVPAHHEAPEGGVGPHPAACARPARSPWSPGFAGGPSP